MSFFLLKWVFNAIKQESSTADEKLKGQFYVNKKEVVSQLSKNAELMTALSLSNGLVLSEEIKQAACVKEGCMTWPEFLNFFYNKSDQKDGWWTKLDLNGKRIVENLKTSARSSNQLNAAAENTDAQEISYRKQLLKEFKEVTETPQLKLLSQARKARTEAEVQADFLNRQKQPQIA